MIGKNSSETIKNLDDEEKLIIFESNEKMMIKVLKDKRVNIE